MEEQQQVCIELIVYDSSEEEACAVCGQDFCFDCLLNVQIKASLS